MSFNFLSGINAFGSGVVGMLIPFLFVLTLVVFFHELGHFLVARWAGVRVLVFSIGFGPELFGFNDRHGTRWKVSPPFRSADMSNSSATTMPPAFPIRRRSPP